MSSPATPQPSSPLQLKVSFEARDISFRQALKSLSALSGVPLTWHPAVPPERLETPVDLEVSGMPLGLACRWLGRLADLHLQEDPGGSPAVLFTLPETAAPERGEWALTCVPVGRLVTAPPLPPVLVRRTGSFDRLDGRSAAGPAPSEPLPGQPESRARLTAPAPDPFPGLLAHLDEALRARREEEEALRRQATRHLLETLRPLTFTAYEHPHPLRMMPGGGDLLLVDQPASGRPWVLEAIAALSNPLPPSGLGEEDRLNLESLDRLWTGLVNLPEGEVETAEAIRSLARQGGINLGWDPRELAGAVLRRVRLPGGRMSLGSALRILMRQAGFLRLDREPGGVWLVGPREAGAPGRLRWVETYTLAAYPMEDLDRLLGAATVQGVLHSRLPQGTWEEPGAVRTYHAPTGRLLVRHRSEIQVEVLALLALLRRDGAAPP